MYYGNNLYVVVVVVVESACQAQSTAVGSVVSQAHPHSRRLETEPTCQLAIKGNPFSL